MAPSDSPQLVFTLAPKMEASRQHSRLLVPAGEGFEAEMRRLLSPLIISPKSHFVRRMRSTGKGRARQLLPAKQCAQGLLPYLLPPGEARGKVGQAVLDQVQWLCADIDKAPMTVPELLDLLASAFDGVKRATWTTWSCADGRASARLVFPLSRLSTFEEVCSLWWWARRRLEEAGLPDGSYDGSGPTLDPRLDAKLFYLPAYPESRVVGDEGWGGTIPCGYVSEDADALLDVDAVLPEAHRCELADRESFATRWPGIPLPGGKAKGARGGKNSPRLPVVQSAWTGQKIGGKAKGGSSQTMRVDFSEVMLGGTTTSLREWADAHLAPGQKAGVGSPFRPDGGSGLAGKSLYVNRDDDGRLWAYDFGTEITYQDVSGALTAAPIAVIAKAAKGVGAQPRRVSAKARAQAAQARASRCPTTGEELEATGRLTARPDGSWKLALDPEDLIQQRYLDPRRILKLLDLEIEALVAAWKPAPDSRKISCTVWKAGQGRGKTHAAQTWVKYTLERGGRVVAVSPTRSLSRDSARRYQLPCYLDESPTGYLEGSVATCSQSLHRVPHFQCEGGELTFRAHGADLLILDEVEQIVSSWGGAHLKDSEARGAYEAAVRHVGVAKGVMLMDADAGDLTQALLTASGRDPASTLWIEAPPAARRAMRVIDSYPEALAEAIREAREHRVAIACQSVAEAATVGKALPLWCGLPTLVLSAETIDRYDLADLEAILKVHGHIVYTPVLGTGVSIDLVSHFHRVYAFLHDGVGTSPGALQLLSRVRYPVEREVVVARLGGAREPEAWEKDASEVRDRWYRRESHTLKKIGFTRNLPQDLCVVVAGGLQVDKRVASYVELMSMAHAQSVREGRGQVVHHLCAHVSKLGWKVVVQSHVVASEEAVEARDVRKQARAEVTGEAISAIVQAQDLEPKELERVQRRGPTSREEKLGLRRAALTRFYGEGAADDEKIVAWDDRGKGRSRARAFAHAVAASEGGAALDTLLRLDYKEVERGTSAVRLSHRFVKAKWLADLAARLLGQSLSQHSPITTPSQSAVTVSSTAAQGVATFLDSPLGRRLAALLGITVRADVTSNPMQLASSLLTACGLRLKAKQVRVPASTPGAEDDRVRVYSVDLDDLAELQERSAIYLAALRSGTIASDSSEEGGDAPAAPKAAPIQAEVIDLDRWRAFQERILETERNLEAGIASFGT